MRNRTVLAALCVALSCTAAARAGTVQVAVAANFAVPMARIAEAFAAATGHVAKLSSGATGKFYAQIVNGAPFEVLLAADERTPQRLTDEGHAVPGSHFTYAVGALVLWSAKPGFIDEQGAVLAGGGFAHLAMADQKVAPYGEAAMQVLRARGLADVLAPKIVTGESIAQAYQFVATGNAELGFISLSQVMQPGKPIAGSVWRVPQLLYTPIRQDAVLLKPGQGNPAAAALLQFLQGPAAREIIRGFGYAE